MFKIRIPLTQRMIEIFIGKAEVSKYNKLTKKMGCSEPITEEDLLDKGGFAYGSVIYVEEFNIGILLHEISHAMDAITMQMGCESESEFKAYMWGYVGLCLENEYLKRISDKIKNKE